jgi:glycosyltransferase involved in cell wall biosynthesis
MRILLAVHAFPPRSTAGVEVYALRQAQALQSLGHEVHVLAAVHDLAAAPASRRLRDHHGVPVHEIVSTHPRGTLAATYDDPAIAGALRGLLRELRPEGVHVHHLLNLSAELIPAARETGARLVLTLHDHWLACPRDGLRQRADLALCEQVDHRICAACLRHSPYLAPPLQRGLASAVRRAGLGGFLHRVHASTPRLAETLLGWLRRLSRERTEDLAAGMDRRAARLREVVGQVDVVLAPTRFVAERAGELGVPEARLRVSPYGAVAEKTRSRPAGPRRRIGYVGTLAPHKGVDVLVAAFRRLSDPGLRLDVHGSRGVSPSYADALSALAGDDPRIRFHGGFEEGGQGAVLAGLDLMVVPSIWWENSPLTVLEALDAGVPVVASRIGGLPELVDDGVTGVLVPPRDVAALHQVLSDVASGARLAEPLPPLPLRSTVDAARELVGLLEGRPA